MSDSCHSGLSKPVIVGFVFSLFFVSQGTGADIGGTIPAPPKPFDSFDVVSYTATRLSDIAGKTPLAKKAGTRKVGSSPMQEESEQRWIVRSIADPDTTYAVRQTTQASGEISLCAYTPNRVLATLLPGKDYAAFAADMSAKGFTVVRELMRDSDDNPVYIVESQESETDIFEAMSMSIQATGFCDKVVPDYVYDLATVPNDALYSEQWALAGTEAPLAWETRTDASSILVAVLDSGINNEHVDLLGNLWLNENETPGDGIDNDGNGVVDDVFGVASSKGVLSGYTMDEIGHGSHCAGIIGAQGNNRKFVAGVAWKARMMALKFMRANGNGTTIDAVACLDYADRAGVNIVNCSFGILGSFDDCLYEQMKKMSRRGVIFVCAAGNAKNGARPQDNDEKPFYPANWNEQLDTVVSVAATDPEDNLAMFSFYGGQRVDIAAPGVDIYSTVLGSTALDYMSGTSMAAPHVTGALALLWAHYPDESATQIIERLYAAAEPIPALSGKVRTGARLSMARFFGIPTPGEIYVSQGSDADAVVVYWAGSKNATHYRVWRAESENGPKTMLRDWTQSLSYSDTDIAPGVTNWYFLQAATSPSGHSASVLSVGIPGFRPAVDNSRVTVSFNPAGGTLASNSRAYTVGQPYGEFPAPSCGGKAFLGWYAAATGGTRIDATDMVRRDVTTLFARWIDENALRIENLTALQRYPWNGLVDIDFVLHGVPNGASASVSLIASNPDGGDALSVETFVGASPTGLTNGIYHFIWNATPDTQNSLYPDLILNASISIDLLPAPSSGTATNNPATRAIEVSWSAVSGATSYQIWSGTTEDFNDAELLTTQGGTALTDLSATVGGQVYHYWIKTVSPGGVSADALHLSVTRASYEETGSMDLCFYPFMPGWNMRGLILVPEKEYGESQYANSPTFRFESGAEKWFRLCIGNLGEVPVDGVVISVLVHSESGPIVAEMQSRIPLGDLSSNGFLPPGYSQEGRNFCMEDMISLPPGNYGLLARLDPEDALHDVRRSNNVEEYFFTVLPEETNDFNVALDCPELVFSPGANNINPPFTQPWQSNYGGSAVQFGPQNHSETNSLFSTVTGPGTISFSIWPKTESGCDNFVFLIDGVMRERWSGEWPDWERVSHNLGEGVHQLEWRYEKDYYGEADFDIVYLDRVTWIPGGADAQTLALAVGAPAMSFETGGDAEWIIAGDEWHSGGSCAKSGTIEDGESSWMQTEVYGAGRLTFMVKTSCEANYDKLLFLVDGVQKTSFSGTDPGWSEFACDIVGDAGHVLKWTYLKDTSDSEGEDCCWIDSIIWTPAGEPTFIMSGGVLTHVELNGTSDVIIPDGVTKIGDNVFEGTYVTSVKCPSSLRTIGIYAFHECTSLTNITFHAGLQTIEDGAFCGCSSLTGVFEIPEGVADVAFGAFMWSGINTLVFPSTLNHLGAQIVLNNPLVAVYFKGNAPQLDEVGSSAYPNEKSPYCNANPNLITYVSVGSTGWKDSTTALPATWPTYDGRPIQHYSGTPPRGTSGVFMGK